VALLGWGSLASDLALRSLAATPNPEKGYGTWNWAHYSNPTLDKLIEQSLATVDPARRETAARAASAFAAREVVFIPLHYQIVSWAMKRTLDYAARTDEFTFAHQFRSVAK
jgi:peptide/nickel transport system substrate-binding protein